MCTKCQRARRRRAAVLALTPVLTIGQPLVTSLVKTVRDGAASDTAISQVLGDITFVSQAQAANDPKPVKYTCPMHPHYIAEDMGACPICGMDLVKLQSEGDSLSPSDGESRTAISIPSETIQSIGVRLGKAELSTFGRGIRSYGIVHENERKRIELTARVEGWVEDLKVTAVGDKVRKGDLLFKLYSPQLIISQGDFLRSRGTRDLAGRGEGQLRAFGVQRRAINEIRQRKRPMELVPFYAEQDGTVSELNLIKGTYVKRGMMLARIQDYSKVWLQIGVPEKDLGFISRDTPALVTFPNLPGRQVSATVDYVYPTVDTNTRTGRVRLVIENKDGRIRPGSYADVVFQVNEERRLAVPSEAVLRSGAGRYVVVSLGEGRFEPRLIEAGLASDGRTEIKQGVLAGEDVVVSGQFLLDSESALRESFRKLQKLQVPLSLLKLTKTEFAMVDHLIDASLYVHEALVDGYDVVGQQLDAALAIKALLWPRYKDTQLAFVLDDAGKAVKRLQKARTESEVQAGLAQLNETLRAWVLKSKAEHYRGKKVVAFRDPKSDRIWFQLGSKPLNPYARDGGELIPYPEPKPDQAESTTAAAGSVEAASSEAAGGQ